MCKVAAELGRFVPDLNLCLTTVKSSYLIGDTFWLFTILIWKEDSSENQSNMKDELREYMRRISLSLLVIRVTVLRLFSVVESRLAAYGVRG